MGDPEPILSRAKMPLRERVRAPDSYGLLLVFILASILTIAAVSGSQFGRVVSLVFLGGTLLFAMTTSRAGHKLRRLAWVIVPIMVFATAISTLSSDDAFFRSAAAAVSALLVLAAMAAILGRLATHTTISFQTVLGALSIYLLLGLLFASVFDLLGLASGSPFFAQGASASSSVNFVYFSYVTIATVGYGDLSAATNVGKMLSASEALLGQLFLVTVVALFVTNLGKAKRVRTREGESSSGEPPAG